MGTWSDEKHLPSNPIGPPAKYAPRDLTDSKDFTKELRAIESNQTLSYVDKWKYKKQLMRAVYLAKQQEIQHHLDSYENYLLARKDVEMKTITLEAQKAIMIVEKEQLKLMKEMGLSHADEISTTLIKVGEMLTGKLAEIEQSGMRTEIKAMTFTNVRRIWEKTNDRIMQSVDTYIDELYQKERERS